MTDAGWTSRLDDRERRQLEQALETLIGHDPARPDDTHALELVAWLRDRATRRAAAARPARSARVADQTRTLLDIPGVPTEGGRW